MKKQVLYHLLAIVSVVLLIGLIVSCGGNEPQFKVIESRQYDTTNQNFVRDVLLDKYFKGKTPLSNPNTIMEPYWNDVWPLIRAEVQKYAPGVVVWIVMKVDTYKLLGRTYYNTNGNIGISFFIFNN